ncbi:alpha/beta hydrolase [Streptomyces sp. LNU-CPARS28]|uniref:alpha/beta hydrolase n=1 Tax=Streptomyces sp. LNU-CPARS28 TaxID=3137371 RepID=UPI003134BBE1
MNRVIRRRHTVVIALAVLGSVSLAACSAGAAADRPKASGAAADPATRPELKAFYGQKLKWTSCGDGDAYECADLTVPMDYAHPGNGKTFVLPVARALTARSAKRIGSLVFNPGGPGESGVQFLQDGAADDFSRKMRDRFDIVSFDPRGVAGSKPALTCTTKGKGAGEADEGEAQAAGAVAPLYPRTAAERADTLAGAREEAAACKKASGAILPHVGTEDAARDMDVLRAALGEEKLTYTGWSYGTSLGTSYAEQFPKRVRAMVLDGAVDPSLKWSDRVISQAKGFERAVDDYAEYCADVAGDDCPADAPEGIRTLIDGLYETAQREPLPVDGDEYGLDASMVLTAITMAMYTPEQQWKGLSRALREAGGGDGTKLAALAAGEEPAPGIDDSEEPTEDPGASDGSDTSGAADDEPPADNGEAALLAINCLDTPHARDPQAYWDALAPADKAAGVYGTSGVTTELACTFLPSGERQPHRVDAKGVAPVLVVGTTGDAATPYEEATSLAEQFPGGMLLTYEGLGHTAYGRSNSCVESKVDAYLIGLKKIRPDATC